MAIAVKVGAYIVRMVMIKRQIVLRRSLIKVKVAKATFLLGLFQKKTPALLPGPSLLKLKYHENSTTL